MKGARPLFAVVVVVALLALANPWTASPMAQSPAVSLAIQLSDAYAEIAGRLEPSVVSIDVTERVRPARRYRGGPDRAPRMTEGVGSGFIVDPSGYVLTNNHVVEGADEISIRLSDGRSLDAAVVGTDPETDLAVLRVNAGFDLTALRFGDSDAARPGNLVLALGTPFGFENSVSAGIISAKNRVIEDGDEFQRFIQTDAAIHPGNSGGPLVNMAGEVIGINTAIITSGRSSSSGVGFALPSNTAASVYRQLIANGRVVRGSIGIYLSDAVGGGVEVNRVVAGSPASAAGLRSGDLIVEVEGNPVVDVSMLTDFIAMRSVGSSIELGISRGGATVTRKVEVADRADMFEERADGPTLRIPR